MKFRRSVKSERLEANRPVHLSIPQKDAIAIEPPKKVIKALYDWAGNEQAAVYLSFSAGDFLHVVGRENDPEWYEACNPLKNERGLVPVKFFENVGKTVRDSGDSGDSVGATHDSGYAEDASASSAPLRSAVQSAPASAFVPNHRSSKSLSKSAAGVYGIVAYDFHAERPDELDAREGEAIIVIAQSNPEWFVAKPITRLGGPGLIPVSFIELRDMNTGQPVADPLDAVQRAGIPRVEEWKRMAAEYKNTSIPLGTVSSTQQVQSLQQSMDRLSVNSGHQNAPGHTRQGSGVNFHQQQENHQNLLAPIRASVPRYVYEDNQYHFVVECKMSNGTHWDLSRVYHDFYHLQTSLLSTYLVEAGQAGKPRTIPYMPGPVQIVTDNISEGRRASLDEYLRDLLQMPEHIINSSLVKAFFAPRPGDYEVDPTAVYLDDHARACQGHDSGSRGSYGSQENGLYQQQSPYNQPQAAANGYGQQRQQQSTSTAHYRAPSESVFLQSSSNPYASHAATQSNSSFAQQQLPHSTDALPLQSSQQQQPPPSTTTPAPSKGPIKVKVWYDRDTCVVIRMPPREQFDFATLYNKIAERRVLEYRNHDNPPPEDEALEIQFRDERIPEYFRIVGDADLEAVLDRIDNKMTVAVRKDTRSEEERDRERELGVLGEGE